AISVLVALLLLLIREVRQPPAPMQWGGNPRWQKRLRVSLVAIVLLLAFVVFWAFLVEPNRLVVRQQAIQIDNWPQELKGLRIAVISDIHAGGSFIDEKKLQTIVERTNELHPELIIILGDYMSGNGGTSRRIEPEVFGPVLKNLSAPLGVYSVLGNHDWWYNGNKVRRGLESNGIKVLDDEVLQINARGTSLWLVGLADLWTRAPQTTADHIAETVNRVPQGVPMIAL